MALVALLLPLPSRLTLVPGLDGTYCAPGGGLSDKQLGLINWIRYTSRASRKFASAAAAAAEAESTFSHFVSPPYGKASSELWPNQTGLDGYRYGLAFAAYAVAQMGAVQTPAFPEQTADVLRDTFARLVSSRVWSYWDTPGSCGEPWTVVCKYTGKSVCELNTMGSSWCPDPVLFQNSMYSGHLLQVGVLYEAFSADPSLSTVGRVPHLGDRTRDERAHPRRLRCACYSPTRSFARLLSAELLRRAEPTTRRAAHRIQPRSSRRGRALPITAQRYGSVPV
jgi:hypothetical protein